MALIETDPRENTLPRELEAHMQRTHLEAQSSDALSNVMIGMIREVRDDVKGVSSRLDLLATERRREAENTGKFSARLSTVEDRQRVTRSIAGAALAGVVLVVFVAFIKLIAAHPDVLGK